MEGRKILQWGVSGIGVAVVIGYSCFVLFDFVRGPRIILTNPRDGFSTTTPLITVVGIGVHTNNITVNDNKTAVDLEGNFQTQLILAPGYNIIKVTAKDSYGRVEDKKIEIALVVPLSATTTQEVTMGTTTPFELMGQGSLPLTEQARSSF